MGFPCCSLVLQQTSFWGAISNILSPCQLNLSLCCFFFVSCSFSLAVSRRPRHTSSDGAPDHQRRARQLLPGEDGVPALHRQLQPSRAIHLETRQHAHWAEQGQRSGHLRAALHSGTHGHTHGMDTQPGVQSVLAFRLSLQEAPRQAPPPLNPVLVCSGFVLVSSENLTF